MAFNLGRVETRMANRVRAGINGAFSDRLDRSWFDALADADDEAEAMHQRHQAMAAQRQRESEATRTAADDAEMGV